MIAKTTTAQVSGARRPPTTATASTASNSAVSPRYGVPLGTSSASSAQNSTSRALTISTGRCERTHPSAAGEGLGMRTAASIPRSLTCGYPYVLVREDDPAVIPEDDPLSS